MSVYVVKGMLGFGDNMYQRPFVKTLAAGGDVFLTTPWPELFEDIPRVRLVRSDTKLRTQGKNVARQTGRAWAVPPTRHVRAIRVEYSRRLDRCKTLMASMGWAFGVTPTSRLELPAFAPPAAVVRAAEGRPLALVRPATERLEWLHPARNPLPEYLALAAEALLAAGFFVVSVADLEPGAEWLAPGRSPPADYVLHHGELGPRELLGLVRVSGAVLGGVGWILPAAAAYRTPALIVAGGAGGWNAPEILTDRRWMALDRLTWAVPRPYCRCRESRHQCTKDIPDFGGTLEAWVRGLAVPQREAASASGS